MLHVGGEQAAAAECQAGRANDKKAVREFTKHVCVAQRTNAA